jgi:hypothetical protein
VNGRNGFGLKRAHWIGLYLSAAMVGLFGRLAFAALVIPWVMASIHRCRAGHFALNVVHACESRSRTTGFCQANSGCLLKC